MKTMNVEEIKEHLLYELRDQLSRFLDGKESQYSYIFMLTI